MLATVHVLHPKPSVMAGNCRDQAETEGLEHGSIFMTSIDISPKNNSTSCSRRRAVSRLSAALTRAAAHVVRTRSSMRTCILTRRSRQLEDLSRVPELRRAEHLLLRHIDPAVRSARQCARLKLDDEKVARVVVEAKKRLIRLCDALGDLHAKGATPTRSRPLTFRSGSSSINAVIGR
jgi:hypothetical protein